MNGIFTIQISYTVRPMDPSWAWFPHEREEISGLSTFFPLDLRWGGVVAEDGLDQLDMTGPFGHLQRKVAPMGRWHW